MIEKSLGKVYEKFKIHFYQSVFEKIENRELTLTTVETFCIEIIYALDHPTVSEFADYIKISSPNAAYKVNCLIRKGYLRKVQDQKDKRKYYLEVTEKYMDYYNISTSYMETVMKRVEKHFSEEELELLNRMLEDVQSELMGEVAGLDRIE